MQHHNFFERFFACGAEELADGEMKRIEPPGLPPVAIYRMQGAFFATDDTCSHGQVSLSEGELEEDGVVFCPFHGGSFDVRTGSPLSPPCMLPVRSYPVEVENGQVYVDLTAGSLGATGHSAVSRIKCST